MKNNEMKLFTIGPAQMYQHTIDVRNQVVPYFRTSEFSNIMLENKELLIKSTNAEKEAEVIFLTASGSGAMEATIINCFNEKDKLLIISGGTFGERFEKICEIHKIPFVALKLGPDEELTAEHFLKYDNQGFSALLVNLHETYTGQLYNIEIIHNFCKRNRLYLVVDAISTFLCDEYDIQKYGIDVTIISSQKGLCLAPGLSMVIISKKMVEEKVMMNNALSLYFDFKNYILDMKRGQTPFTPCVGVCLELNDMLLYINQQGVNKRIQEVKKRCDYFREKIKGLPIYLPSFPLSNAISPIRFKKNIAMEFFQYLKDERKIMVNPVGGELGKNSIRVAHIGDLSFKDYDQLLDEIKFFFEFN